MSEQQISVVSPPGLVSILVPCCGQLEYTRLCVPSVLRHSRPPFELIFLDIGSLDGTAEYLAGVRPSGPAGEQDDGARVVVVGVPVGSGEKALLCDENVMPEPVVGR